MRHYVLCSITVLFVAGLVVSSVEQASAIPAFARKYKTSCTTCHIAIPMRNSFGEAFRRNGYAMSQADAALIKQPDVSLGADEWKDEFPNAIWPGVIPPSFPISAYVHQRLVIEMGEGTSNNSVEFDMPHEFEVFVGMNFAERISVFGEFILFEKGANVGVGKNGLKRLFFQFNDVLGPENAVNIRMGRFEPGITDGYTDNNRMDLEHPLALDYKAAGTWRPRNQQSGVELNGFPHRRFQYAVGVVNGETKTIGDDTDRKDFYGRVAAKVGGTGFDGDGEDLTEGLKIADNWRDDAITVGLYAYHGNEAMSNAAMTPSTWDNSFNRFGVDVSGSYDRLIVRGGIILGTDDNPFDPVDADSVELDSQAFFVEADYIFLPWVIATVRAGRATSELGDRDWEEFFVLDPVLTLLVRPNVRLSLQLHVKDTQRSGGVEIDDQRTVEWFKTNVLIAF